MQAKYILTISCQWKFLIINYYLTSQRSLITLLIFSSLPWSNHYRRRKHHAPTYGRLNHHIISKQVLIQLHHSQRYSHCDRSISNSFPFFAVLLHSWNLGKSRLTKKHTIYQHCYLGIPRRSCHHPLVQVYLSSFLALVLSARWSYTYISFVAAVSPAQL